jgi:hypothetical protein
MAINLATFSETTKAGEAFLLSQRAGITGGFIGIGHGWRQIQVM